MPPDGSYSVAIVACVKLVETVENLPFDWSRAREALRTHLGSEIVGRWLGPLRLSSVSSESIVLEAPNAFFRDWVNAHYLDRMQEFIGNRKLRIVVGAEVTSSQSPVRDVIPAAITSLQSTMNQSKRPAPSTMLEVSAPLNVKFNFERFVVGGSNRFAHAASLAVSESPAKAYNPLFIYGGVGLGKTHLMQAIGHAVLARWSTRRVVYTSSEGFTNGLIHAIQTRTTAKFRERYRNVDVLLIDDIHFIAQKEATQEEFFHTFNVLYDAHKQIVISSDRAPKDIAGLEERLVSRFEWGLVTDIQAPDLETRIAILRKKAQESKIEVPDAVTEFIGQQVTANIRELEGALIRVIAYCDLFNKPATPALAQEILKDMVREVRGRLTLERIQQRVAGYFQLDVNALRSARRQRSILYPRQIAMYLCRRLTEASLPEIGRAFGGRDHTTVMHAVEKIDREITQDPHKRSLVEHLSQVVVATED